VGQVDVGFVVGKTLKFRNGHGMLLSAVKFVSSRPWLAYLDIGVSILPKRNIKCRRHSHKFAPSSNLLDLKQSAAIGGLKLLTLKPLPRKPTLG
jgi:hypothetical protein